MTRKFAWLCVALLLNGAFNYSSLRAAPAWVSDVFEITLRTGPSSDNVILMVVPSGTELTVLEEDGVYTRVQTLGGTEGWVLTRYLMDEPSAREKLGGMVQKLTNSQAYGESMAAELDEIRAEYDDMTRALNNLQQDKITLESELKRITDKAENVIAIDSQNVDLQQKLTTAEIQINLLEDEKDRLLNQSDRKWFFIGALVLLGGIFLGFVLPYMKFQRRTRYDQF